MNKKEVLLVICITLLAVNVIGNMVIGFRGDTVFIIPSPEIIKETVIVEKRLEMPTATSAPTSTPTRIPTSTLMPKPTSTPTAGPTNIPTSTPTYITVHIREYLDSLKMDAEFLWDAIMLEYSTADGKTKIPLEGLDTEIQIPMGTEVGLWIGPELGGLEWWSRWDCPVVEVTGPEVTLTITKVEQPCPDRDGDGYRDEACGGTDCNDYNPDIHPGAYDPPRDGIDWDCDGDDGEEPRPLTPTPMPTVWPTPQK